MVLPYVLLKYFFYDTGWVGAFIILYFVSPIIFGLYLYLLKKQQISNARYLLMISIVFVTFLSFIFWDIYNIVLAGFNFKML